MIRPFLSSVFVFSTTALFAAPVVPLVNLVDDQTLIAVSITDAPALLRGWDASPLAKTWQDPQIVKFLAPARAQMHIDEWDAETKAATGMDVREILSLAKGEALIALPTTDFSKVDKHNPPPVLIALEVGDQGAKIEKILADFLAKESLTEQVDTFSGVKVHTRDIAKKTATDADDKEAGDTPEKLSWAISEGVWLISLQKERVFTTIDSIKQGGSSTALGKSERFLRTRQRTPDSQALFYVNFPAVYPLIRDSVVALKAQSKGKPNTMGVDPEVAFNALGLDAIGEVYASLQTGPKETVIDAGMAYTEDRGLLKLAAYQTTSAPRPEWIPAKWPVVSTASFSVPRAYEGLEELLAAISPMMSAMAQGQIRTFNKQLGLDVKRDLIGSIGTEIVSAYVIPAGYSADSLPAWDAMDQVFSISLANEASMIKSIEALKKLAGPVADQLFDKREYLGNTLYTLKSAPVADGQKAPRAVSYSIANGKLLIGVGSSAGVESALQGIASKDGGFWKREDVKAVLADVPADVVSLQVQDMRVIISSMIQMAVTLDDSFNAGVKAGSGSSSDVSSKYFDVSAKPDAELISRYWGMAGGYATKTPEGIFTKSRIAHPQK